MFHRIGRSSAKTRPRRLLRAAQGLVEYALILALVAILAVGATAYLGTQVGTTLSDVGGAVLGANQTGPTPTATPTSGPNPGSIHNSSECWNAGYFWYSSACHSTPGSSGNYHNSGDCFSAGFFWQDDNSCHSSQGNANNYNNSSSGCALAGFFWYANDCHSSPQPPPPPPDGAHTVGVVCQTHRSSPDETWHWDVTWSSSGSGHWNGSWDCRV